MPDQISLSMAGKERKSRLQMQTTMTAEGNAEGFALSGLEIDRLPIGILAESEPFSRVFCLARRCPQPNGSVVREQDCPPLARRPICDRIRLVINSFIRLFQLVTSFAFNVNWSAGQGKSPAIELVVWDRAHFGSGRCDCAGREA
jgi:hypothetical protein